jgi:hypothetical protein
MSICYRRNEFPAAALSVRPKRHASLRSNAFHSGRWERVSIQMRTAPSHRGYGEAGKGRYREPIEWIAVMPDVPAARARAGIQGLATTLGSRVRGNDELQMFAIF